MVGKGYWVNKAKMKLIIRESDSGFRLSRQAIQEIEAKVELLVKRSLSAAMEDRDSKRLIGRQHVDKAGRGLFI